jgi:hypothetical protein
MAIALATVFQDSVVLARSNAYNQEYWNARNTYMNGGYFGDYCG